VVHQDIPAELGVLHWKSAQAGNRDQENKQTIRMSSPVKTSADLGMTTSVAIMGTQYRAAA
jgi:hypothetical protein